MSPITTGSDIYRIEPMGADAIRANNYLAGYVDQANGVLPTDYVRVDLQAGLTVPLLARVSIPTA